MGGTTSKFDKTQWWRSNGELAAPSEEAEYWPTILPKESPTHQLQIYDIIKTALTSQRDFLVRDGQSTVYRTATVAGTLAAFDLIQPSDPADYNNEDTPLLRVTTSSNRRTWIVYAYDTPMFPGQVPAAGEVVDGHALFKSCCITTSFSRSLAVATRYGPPTKLQDFILEDGSVRDSMTSMGDSQGSDFFDQVNNIAQRRREGEPDAEAAGSTERAPTEQNDNTPKNQKDNALADPWGGFEAETSLDPEPTQGLLAKVAQSTTKFLFENTPSPMSKKERQAKAQMASLEGVVNLDDTAPIMFCQSILKSTHHQTSLITKQDVLKFWKLDNVYRGHGNLEEEEEDPSEDPLGKAVAYERETHPVTQDLSELQTWWLGQYMDGEDKYHFFDKKNGWFHFRGSVVAKEDGETTPAENELNLNEEATEEQGGATQENKTDIQEDEPKKEETPSRKEETAVYGSSQGMPDSPKEEDPNRMEPLVAHWEWKNTLRQHKMQMHLSQNSDLALHVVLSVIVNILRYEKSLLKMKKR